MYSPTYKSVAVIVSPVTSIDTPLVDPKVTYPSSALLIVKLEHACTFLTCILFIQSPDVFPVNVPPPVVPVTT